MTWFGPYLVTESSAQCNFAHWPLQQDLKGFSSDLSGGVDCLQTALVLAQLCDWWQINSFCHHWFKIWLVWPIFSTQSHLHNVTSLIGLIWRIWKGTAVTYLVELIVCKQPWFRLSSDGKTLLAFVITGSKYDMVWPIFGTQVAICTIWRIWKGSAVIFVVMARRAQSAKTEVQVDVRKACHWSCVFGVLWMRPWRAHSLSDDNFSSCFVVSVGCLDRKAFPQSHPLANGQSLWQAWGFQP
jgi:hypothetical protein